MLEGAGGDVIERGGWPCGRRAESGVNYEGLELVAVEGSTGSVIVTVDVIVA